MTDQINTFALGVQGLLSLKGQNIPNQLGEIITPTIDITQQYLLGVPRERVQLPQIAPFTSGINVSTGIVPVGETWYVWNYIIAVNTSAVQTATYRPIIRVQGNSFAVGETIVAPISNFTQAVATAPFWADSGMEFGCLGVVAPTGAPAANVALVISRLKT